MSVSLLRYLTWLGLSCKAFHLSDYRREALKGADMPADYFFFDDDAKVREQTKSLRNKVAAECFSDILQFLSKDGQNGQIIIYDAVNASRQTRRKLQRQFAGEGIQTLFIESVCTDEKIIQANVRNVKVTSPDYQGWDPQRAVEDYLHRISSKIPHYEEMTREEEDDLSWVKMINIGERMVVNKGTTAGGKGGSSGNFGYLGSRIVFFLMNLHVKPRTLYFARAGKSADRSYRSDAPLSEEGLLYARKMADTVLRRREFLRQEAIEAGLEPEERSLTVWTSPRQRTVASAQHLKEAGCMLRRRPQLSAMNPGVYDTLTLAEIQEKYPGEAEKHADDPFSHRFPRAESYHDVAIRLEPVILEIERERNDLMIIAHESVLKILLGYFMGTPAASIPSMSVPRNQIFEVEPSSYNCRQRVLTIADVAE